MLFRRNRPVQQVHLQHGEEVAGDPVEAHARGDEEAQVQAQTHGDDQHAVFVQLALLRLQGLVPVLGDGHHQGAQGREDRDNQGDAALLDRHPAEVDPQEHQIVRIAFGDQVFDDFHQAQEKDQLDDDRHQAGQGAVFFFLIELRLAFGDGVPVAVVVYVQPVDFRHHPNHFDSVVMHPDADRQQDDFGDQREEDDGQAVVFANGVADVHDGAEGRGYTVENCFHFVLTLCMSFTAY